MRETIVNIYSKKKTTQFKPADRSLVFFLTDKIILKVLVINVNEVIFLINIVYLNLFLFNYCSIFILDICNS